MTRRPIAGALLATRALVTRRLWADAPLVVLYCALVCVSVALVVIAPRLATTASEEGVRAAVASSGQRSDVVAAISLDDTHYNVGRVNPSMAQEVQSTADKLHERLDDSLAQVLVEPVVTVTSRTLALPIPEAPDATLRLLYVWSPSATGVEWVSGEAPGTDPVDINIKVGQSPPIEVGMSEQVARTAGVSAGDLVDAQAPSNQVFTLKVTGIFRPLDPTDDVWAHAPGLVDPVVAVRDGGTRVALGALLGDGSLPVARLQQEVNATVATYTFAANPQEFTVANSHGVIQSVGQLRSKPTDLTLSAGPAVGVATELDQVLTDYAATLRSATAQGAVVAITLAIVSMLALIVCGGLLAARRRPVLAMELSRGSSLVAVVTRVGLESAGVTLVGVVAGAAVADAIAPAGVTWLTGLFTVAMLAAIASPLATYSTLRRESILQRPAANRSDRRRALAVSRARRAVAEGVLVVLALSALIAARARGVTQSTTAGIDPLLVAAPVLVALAATLVLVRLLPFALRAMRRATTRTRGSIGLLSTARAQSAQYGGPAVTAITLALSMIVMCGVLAGAVTRAQEAAAVNVAGADVRVMADDAGLRESAPVVGVAPGVDAVALARVEGKIQVRSGGKVKAATLLLVDSEAYAQLAQAQSTPPIDSAALTATGGPPPALVTTGVVSAPGPLDVFWNSEYVTAAVAGRIGQVPGVAGPAVVIDAGRFATQLDGDVPLNTMWVAGPGADAAVASAPQLAKAIVVSKADYLVDVRGAPLTRALSTALDLGVWLFALFAALVLVLWVIASSPERSRTLSALRTLGLGSRAATLISIGELTPLVAASLLAAGAIGFAVPVALGNALGLDALSGGVGAPVTWVWPAWWVACGAAVAAVLITVTFEAAARRRTRLGQVLRVGGPS